MISEPYYLPDLKFLYKFILTIRNFCFEPADRVGMFRPKKEIPKGDTIDFEISCKEDLKKQLRQFTFDFGKGRISILVNQEPYLMGLRVGSRYCLARELGGSMYTGYTDFKSERIEYLVENPLLISSYIQNLKYLGSKDPNFLLETALYCFETARNEALLSRLLFYILEVDGHFPDIRHFKTIGQNWNKGVGPIEPREKELSDAFIGLGSEIFQALGEEKGGLAYMDMLTLEAAPLKILSELVIAEMNGSSLTAIGKEADLIHIVATMEISAEKQAAILKVLLKNCLFLVKRGNLLSENDKSVLGKSIEALLNEKDDVLLSKLEANSLPNFSSPSYSGRVKAGKRSYSDSPRSREVTSTSGIQASLSRVPKSSFSPSSSSSSSTPSTSSPSPSGSFSAAGSFPGRLRDLEASAASSSSPSSSSSSSSSVPSTSFSSSPSPYGSFSAAGSSPVRIRDSGASAAVRDSGSSSSTSSSSSACASSSSSSSSSTSTSFSSTGTTPARRGTVSKKVKEVPVRTAGMSTPSSASAGTRVSSVGSKSPVKPLANVKEQAKYCVECGVVAKAKPKAAAQQKVQIAKQSVSSLTFESDSKPPSSKI